nr:MAG TPA: ParB protein [Caudoviricetes sp.]
MNVITMPISELKRPERNVRIHTDKQLKEFERSIRMFGQIRPLVVDETNTILAGVGCFETLCRMGATEAAVYKVSDLTESQKKKLMIADNKIYGLGIDNLETFDSFLKELSDDLDIPGFDESILQSMVAEAEEVTDKIMEYGSVDDSEIESLKAAKARKEALMEKAGQEQEAPALAQPVAVQQPVPAPSNLPPADEEDTEPTEIRKFVICPNCGEKIWL